jgi:type I restriction enzyme R subunit
VAFSGEVNDPETGPDPFTEHSVTLNPRLKRQDIAQAFDGEDYHILLVANKFQTGFDQPLLCGMYVDKRLSGIQAVQTLSRLNRACDGKDTTYIVDFANDEEDILKAFKTYYATAELSSTSDRNIVLNLRTKLDSQGHYDDGEVDRVIRAIYREHNSQAEVVAALTPISDRLLKRYRAADEAYMEAVARSDVKTKEAAEGEMGALTLFRSDMETFVRVYTFLSQIFDYANTDIEKRSIFYKLLLPRLKFGRERTDIDLSEVVMTHHA